jgi:molybdopterin-dependent oxidoreductase alpha subunit
MKTSKPLKAGGLASVQSTIKHLLQSKRTKENIKNLLRVNQSNGFDCPGCAWGDNTKGSFQFCENGAKAVAWESTDKTLTPLFFKEHSVTQLMNQSDYWLEYQGRLCQPMRYNKQSDHYEVVSWPQAFDIIANKLKSLGSPNDVELYTSGRASNEASYLYQLFGRLYGTNNFPDCSNMCHEASGIALNDAIGVGKGTVVLDDFDHADGIFVWGQNPGTNHPRMMNALRKAAKNGCKILTFNNIKEVALDKFASPQSPKELLTSASTQISHQYLTPKLGGDWAAMRGIAKTIIEDYPDRINTDFISVHTCQFESYVDVVKATTWDEIEQQSGLNKADIHQAALIFKDCEKVISTWAMGLTQHKYSVDTIREITNLHLLCGHIGKKGAGLSPVRGHSNVQGNRTMGINEKPPQDFIERLNKHFGSQIPFVGGHNVNAAIKALHGTKSKVIICLGGNIAAAAPDSNFTYQALKNSELNVQISTKLNRSHLLVGDDALILPCLGRTELDLQKSGPQKITVEDTFSMVHASHGTSTPASEYCRSETDIVAEIAHHTLEHGNIDWLELRDDYAKIRDLIAQTIEGFDDFNKKVASPQGFHLTNSAACLTWNTESKKANFNPVPLPEHILSEEMAIKIAEHQEQIFILQSLRSHDQFNTTIYGLDDRYRGINGDRKVLFINALDAQKLKLKEDELVEIQSLWNDGQLRSIDGYKLVFYDIPQGNLAAYYPETNPLVPIDSYGDKSFTPTSKSIPVSICKSKLSHLPIKNV